MGWGRVVSQKVGRALIEGWRLEKILEEEVGAWIIGEQVL